MQLLLTDMEQPVISKMEHTDLEHQPEDYEMDMADMEAFERNGESAYLQGDRGFIN